MAADPGIYQSHRIAQAYAHARPPVHSPICRRMVERISPSLRVRSALDAGCGAGASTLALVPYVDRLVGVDPYPQMLRLARAALPSAAFEQGSLESLPVASSTFELVATAGAINYAHVPSALAEVSRVLEPDGWLAAYDFSAGRRLASASRLPEAYAAFRAEYPSDPGYGLALETLPYAEAGLTLLVHEQLSLCIPMTARAYVDYVLGDTGVERASAAGVPEQEIRAFCERLFLPVFGEAGREVVFEAEWVLARKPSGERALNEEVRGGLLPPG